MGERCRQKQVDLLLHLNCGAQDFSVEQVCIKTQMLQSSQIPGSETSEGQGMEQRSVSLDQAEGLSTKEDFEEYYYEAVEQYCSHLESEADENRKQGSMTFVGGSKPLLSFREGRPLEFRHIEDHLKVNDFSALRSIWSSEFVNKLNFIIDHWWEFSLSYQDHFKQFIDLFKTNLELFSFADKEDEKLFYNYFYKDLAKVVRKMQRITEYSNKNTPKIEIDNEEQRRMVMNNGAFKHFVREQEAKVKKAGACYIDLTPKEQPSRSNEEQSNDTRQSGPAPRLLRPPQSEKKPIGQFIVEKNIFSNNVTDWKMIMFETVAGRRFNKSMTTLKDIHKEIESVYEFSELLLNNNEMTQPNNRLCCAQFLYYNFDLNPLCNEPLLYRQKLFGIMPKAQEGRRKKESKKTDPVVAKDPAEIEDIMVDLCSLLNGGGGVLLFDCEQQYLEVRPVGESYFQVDKDKYRSLMKQAIKKVYPRVSMEHEIKVSFVPLVKYPYEQGYRKQTLEEEDCKHNRNYIQGLFVMRIAVVPSLRDQLYYYEVMKNQIRTAVLEQGKRRNLSGAEVVLEMKRRFLFYELEEEDEQERELLGKDYTLTPLHRCLEPYKGLPMEVKEDKPCQYGSEGNFRYVSLLVAPQKHYPLIEKRLKAKGIDCWINPSFQKYEFKSAQNSAPIHHNVRFDQLLIETAYKPEFQFDGRFALLINVTHCIKFKDRHEGNNFPKADFDFLNEWLRKEFKEGQLEYWIFDSEDGRKEHYLRTGNSLSLIFIYYVLHKYNEKGLLKNPSLKSQEDKAVYRVEVNRKIKQQYCETTKLFLAVEE